jgi:hypothetical protein
MKNNEFFYTANDDYIMSEDEQKIIIEWLRKNYLKLNENGFKRYMKNMHKIPDIPNCVWDIKQRIVEKENLQNAIEEPEFSDSIGYMMNGGQLHKHTDPNRYGLIHTRFNVYVQIPEKGGYPIYSDQVLKLKERTYICCRAGIDPHYCEKVEGDKERIILSYGFLLPIERIQNIKYYY